MMAHEFVEGRPEHVAVVTFLQDLDVLLRVKDGEVVTDHASVIKLFQALRVEAQRSSSVRNGLQDVN